MASCLPVTADGKNLAAADFETDSLPVITRANGATAEADAQTSGDDD